MPTNYEKGRALEYAVIALFKQRGLTAYRTAGSHGPFDIIAIGQKFVWLIQVKKGRLSPGARKEAHDLLRSVKGPDCIRRQVWMRHDRQWEIQDLHDDDAETPQGEATNGP